MSRRERGAPSWISTFSSFKRSLLCVASAEEGTEACGDVEGGGEGGGTAVVPAPAEGVGEGVGTAVCAAPTHGISRAAAHRVAPRTRLKPTDPWSSGVEFLAGYTSRCG